MKALASIRLCTVAELAAGGGELFREHYDEIALNKHVMRFDPDYDRYQDLEDAGILFALVAEDEGKPVGYSVNFANSHIHYRGLMVCSNDVLFVHKDYRRSGLGRELVDATECEATKRGVKLMLWHAKKDSALDRVLPRWGDYRVQDVIYSRVLP